MSCADSDRVPRNGDATAGLDLHLELSGPKLRAGLEDALREAMQTGRTIREDDYRNVALQQRMQIAVAQLGERRQSAFEVE